MTKGLTRPTRMVQAWLVLIQKFKPVKIGSQFWYPAPKAVVNSKPVFPSEVGWVPFTKAESLSPVPPPVVRSMAGAVTVAPVPQASLAHAPP